MTFQKEKFCLKWNDFKENIGSSYRELRNKPDFYDVTLLCEDYQQIYAHRNILTSNSYFFNTVLSRTDQANPVIYMRGLKAKDLVAIVDFIYHGEVNIHQEDLDGFLVLAKEFKLKGLLGPYIDNPDKINNLSTSKENEFKDHTESDSFHESSLQENKLYVEELFESSLTTADSIAYRHEGW